MREKSGINEALFQAHVNKRQQKSRVRARADGYPFGAGQSAFGHSRIHENDLGAFSAGACDNGRNAHRAVKGAAHTEKIFAARVVGFDFTRAVKALAENHAAAGNGS